MAQNRKRIRQLLREVAQVRFAETYCASFGSSPCCPQELDAAEVLEQQALQSPRLNSSIASGLAPQPESGALSPRTETETEEDELRPSIYSHKPQRRFDEFDRMQGTHVMDALKLRWGEGFYNLSALMLVFSISYIVLKNVLEKGMLVTLNDFTCPQLLRDIKVAACLCIAAVSWSFSVFLVVKSYLLGYLSSGALWTLYIIIQLVLLGGPVSCLYMLPIAPIPSALVLGVTAVLILKMHRCVMLLLKCYGARAHTHKHAHARI